MVEAEVDSLFLPYCFNEVEFKSLSNLKLMLLLVVKRFMMDHLVFYESRAAAADPHRDMRLDIDNMSYEARSACILLQLPCSGNLKISSN